MSKITPDSTVVYRVALNDHPLIPEAGDDRSDEELVTAVEEATTADAGLDFPGWTVEVSDPPGKPPIRYVTTDGRINVRSERATIDPFEEIRKRLYVEGFDVRSAAMSYPGPVHADDFDGEVHLDLSSP